MKAFLALVVLTLAASTASAQVEPMLTMTVAAPAAFDITAGQGASGPVKVDLKFDRVVCAQESVVQVALSVPAANLTEGMAAAVEPATLEVTIPMGQNSVSGSAEAVLNLTTLNTTANTTESGALAIPVVATYAGGLPQGCQGVGTVPETTAAGVIATSIADAPKPPEPVVQQEENDTPAPGWLGVVAALGALAFARRR